MQESVVDRHLEVDSSLEVGRGIFAVETQEIDRLGFSKDELKLLKPYYTSEQIQKYRIKGENHKWIIYTTKEIIKNIDEYPNVKAHLIDIKQ